MILLLCPAEFLLHTSLYKKVALHLDYFLVTIDYHYVEQIRAAPPLSGLSKLLIYAFFIIDNNQNIGGRDYSTSISKGYCLSLEP